MDLELKKESYAFYNTGFDLPGMREETAEAIVPDALPDILRIVGCQGTAMINSREIKDGRIHMKGSVKTFVLYVPEDGEGLAQLEVNLPYMQVFEVHGEGEGVLFCLAEVQSIDCRAINPRKVLVRATVRLQARSLEKKVFSLCAGLRGKPDETSNVQMLRETRSARLPVAVKTKSFTVTDETEIPSTRPAVREVLNWTCRPAVVEYNIIGRKIVLKGNLQFKTLCRGLESFNEVFEMNFDLPFSQIIEVDGMEEGAECFIQFQLEELHLSPGTNSEGRILEVYAGLEAQVALYSVEKLETVSDLYSTTMNSTVDIRPYVFTSLNERTVRRQTVRDSMETEEPVRLIRDMDVLFDAISLTAGDGFVRLETTADCKVLYDAEDGGVYQASKKIPVALRLDTSGEVVPYARVYPAAEAFSVGASGGVEIRFDACFDVELTQREQIRSVASATLEEYGEHPPIRPSVVLKYPNGGESLWSMAKRYNTTEGDIRAANGLEATQKPDVNTLLLIPKRR